MSKVAIVVGGARGIALTTAKALAATGSWTFHIIDLNEDIGNKAAAELGNSSRFYKGDVTSYRSIAEIFEAVFKQAKRLDLVFNSAAIVDRTNFYDQGPVDGPPPEFDQKTSDVNYKGTVTVSYLSQHYFRKNPPEVKDTNLVLMASCTGFYPIAAHPIYVSSKHAVLGFGRSISSVCHARNKIRVNVLCPGVVQTDLYSKDQFDATAIPPSWFTSIDAVAKAAVMVINGTNVADSNGKKLPIDKAWGLGVEISGEKVYFRDPLEYGDAVMAEFMQAISAGAV